MNQLALEQIERPFEQVADVRQDFPGARTPSQRGTRRNPPAPPTHSPPR